MPDRYLELPLEGLEAPNRAVDYGATALVCTDSWEAALSLLFGVRLSESDDVPVILTADAEENRLALRDFVAAHAAERPEILDWTVRRGRRALFALPSPLDELEHALAHLYKTPHALVFLCPARKAVVADFEHLSERLERVAQQAERVGHAVLLLLYGNGKEDDEEDVEKIRLLLASHNRLSGVASLIVRDETRERYLWHARFWHGLHRYSGRIKATLVREGLRFAALGDRSTDNVSRADEHDLYSASAKINPQTGGFRMLRTVADNEALLEIGRRASAATLLFSLDKPSDLEVVARALFELRETRGALLKMAVVAGDQPVRASALAFLLACGANVVFEPKAGINYIYLTVLNLQGSVFSRSLPLQFEKALAFEKALHERGVLSAETFFRRVRSLVSYEDKVLLPLSRGSLVLLDPVDTLDVETCLAHFLPKRAGDIACRADETCLVFLYDCHISRVPFALERCFSVSPNELFRSYRVAFDDLDILSALRKFEDRQGWSVPAPLPRTVTDETAAEEKLRDTAPNPIHPQLLSSDFLS